MSLYERDDALRENIVSLASCVHVRASIAMNVGQNVTKASEFF